MEWNVLKMDVPKATSEISLEVRYELATFERCYDWDSVVELVTKVGDSSAQSLPANDWYRLSRKLEIIKDNWPSVLFAMVGGVVLSLGNLSTQYAWAFVGLLVTEEICASIAVVIGNLDDKINRAEILFPGVVCFLIVVVLVRCCIHLTPKIIKKSLIDYKIHTWAEKGIDLEYGTGTVEKAKAGTADFLIELENQRAIKGQENEENVGSDDDDDGQENEENEEYDESDDGQENEKNDGFDDDDDGQENEENVGSDDDGHEHEDFI